MDLHPEEALLWVASKDALFFSGRMSGYFLLRSRTSTEVLHGSVATTEDCTRGAGSRLRYDKSSCYSQPIV